MVTLRTLINQESAVKADIDEAKIAVAQKEHELHQILRQRKMLSDGLDVDQILTAENCLQIVAAKGKRDHPVIQEAMFIIAEGGEKLMTSRLVGTTDDDPFSEDINGGPCVISIPYEDEGPSNTRWTIGMHEYKRDRGLLTEEMDACLYLLQMIQTGKYVAQPNV